jgi:transposase-like protein
VEHFSKDHSTFLQLKPRGSAVDTQQGRTIDFLLTHRRNAKAAQRFLAKALRTRQHWPPQVINTDKNPAYGEAIAELKKEGRLPKDTQHHQAKYLNNRIEADHIGQEGDACRRLPLPDIY